MMRYLILVLALFVASCKKEISPIAKQQPPSQQSIGASSLVDSSSTGSVVDSKEPAVIAVDPAVREYQEYLTGLDSSDTESIFSAKKYFREHFSGKDEGVSEAALRLFMGYNSNTLASAQKVFDSKPEYREALGEVSGKACGGTINDNAALKKLCEFRKSGIRFDDEEEGTVVRLNRNADFIVSIASGVPGAYASFLRMYYPDTVLPWANDGGLVLTWGQLGERISQWEKFSLSYPDLKETVEIVNPALVQYVDAFTGGDGLPNSPVFASNGEINPNLKKAYESFLENHKDSVYFPEIKKAYETFRAKEPKRDAGFDALQLRINSAKENELIEIPPGQYNVDLGNGLTIKNKKGLRLVGKNGSAIFISNSAELEIVKILNSTGIVVDGLTIYHTVPVGCSAACISIENSDSITIQNSDIHGSGAYGVAAWGHHNKDIRVIKNKIHNCSYFGVEIYSMGGEISQNEFYDNNRNIDIGKPPSQSEGIKIYDNSPSNQK